MLKRLSALSLPFLISLWGGCFEETFDLTEAADLTDPQEYHSNQIFFKYPKNWEISADSNTTAFHNIYIQTQGEAMVIYQSYPSDVAESLTTFSKDFSEKMTQTENFAGMSAGNQQTISPLVEPPHIRLQRDLLPANRPQNPGAARAYALSTSFSEPLGDNTMAVRTPHSTLSV